MPLRVCRWRALTAAVGVTLTAAMASCASEGADGGYARLTGAHLEVLAAWTGVEQARFAEVLRGFTARTGAIVTYTSARHDVPEALDTRIAAGDPPDVALLPQPGLLHRYAGAGRLVPLDSETAGLVRRDYSSVWQALASSGGRPYGVWFKAANKSLLWYNLAAFERVGIAPPGDLGSLLEAERTIRVGGVAPFSVGGGDQWTITDWFENLYLQLAGPRDYDRLAAHRIPWTDQSVESTLRLMAQVLAPHFLRGGVTTTLRTGFEDSVAEAFGAPAGAAMVCEGDFVASVVSSRTRARIGVDVDAAPFPAARPGVPGVVGGGDVAVQLRRSNAAAELMRYLADPAGAAIWAAHGGFISPNQSLDLAVYPDALTRSIARRLIEAGDGFRFDLSDLQPAAFGSTPGAGMQAALREFLVTRDVPATARRLERAAAAAYAARPR
ncbi:MAG TPA: ABC transporter substrate-binding protein [Jatrophihabitantaceae bacterium]